MWKTFIGFDRVAEGQALLTGPNRKDTIPNMLLAPRVLAQLILAVLIAIPSKRVSPLAALAGFPVVASLIAGFGLKTSQFILTGIQGISGVIGMFVFAILFFGVMTDARLLEPLIAWLLRCIGRRPSRIVPGTALLALLVHLDGSGAVVFLLTVPALLPLYQEVGIDRRVLACAVSMAAGVNFLPWTGPMICASAACWYIPAITIFLPMIGVQAVGLLFVFIVAWMLGMREERRLGRETSLEDAKQTTPEPTQRPLPPRFYPNLALTLLALGVMLSGKVDPAATFMLGTVLALMLNFPDLKAQQARIAAHAPAAILMASILRGRRVYGHHEGLRHVERDGGGGRATSSAACCALHPVLMGVASMPLSLIFDPDRFTSACFPWWPTPPTLSVLRLSRSRKRRSSACIRRDFPSAR